MRSNMATACFVYFSGDLAAQYIEKRFRPKPTINDQQQDFDLKRAPEEESTSGAQTVHSGFVRWVDWGRTQDMLFYSVFVYTPYWVFAFKKFNDIWPKATAVQVAKKVLASTLVNIPSLSIFFLFGVVFPPVKKLMLEKTFSGSVGSDVPSVNDLWLKFKTKINSDLFSTMTAGMIFWWPINGLNFKFTPPHLRPVVTSLFSVSWGCYLSLVQYKSTTNPRD